MRLVAFAFLLCGCARPPATPELEWNDPQIGGVPEIAGAGRIRVMMKQSRPDAHFAVMEITPTGVSAIARGTCPGEERVLPEALANDRDGTVHVLCIVTQGAEQNTLAFVHGWARPGDGTLLTFDPPIKIHETSGHATMTTDGPVVAGFDDGGPYVGFRDGSIMFEGSKQMGLFSGRLLSLAGGPPNAGPWTSAKDVLWIGDHGRFGGFAYSDNWPVATVRFHVSGASTLEVPTAMQIRSGFTGALAAAEDERGVVVRHPGVPRVPGPDTPYQSFVAGGHMGSGLESWPADTAVYAAHSDVEFSSAGLKEPVWSIRLPNPERVTSARVSCDRQTCVAVVLVDRAANGEVLRVFRFRAPRRSG